jgi:alpha-L-fucosidase
MDLGIIIHYGLYSIYAYDSIESAKRRKICNGSEWYYTRLLENGKFRPISGYVETQQYHKKYFSNCDYFDQSHNLKPTRQKIKQLIKTCSNLGFKYIILTAKHHDGFCLFNTKTTHKKSDNDICKIFSEECKKIGIEYGFYYSWFECDINFNIDYFNNYCENQINELLRYNPHYLWFDGDWKITQKQILNKINLICKSITSLGIKINDRIGKQKNYDYCTYNVKSDRYIPTSNIDANWQHVTTIGYSWGYNQFDKYKDGKELYKLYLQVQELNGNFLLNVGPTKDFIISEGEMSALKEFSKFFQNERKQQKI